MSVALRIMLFFSSVATCVYISRKLRKSQIQVMDTVFWIGLSVVFVILSVFPIIASGLADLMGIQAPVNFVFLLIIFLLLIRCFLMSIRISQLEERLKCLTQEWALRENDFIADISKQTGR